MRNIIGVLPKTRAMTGMSTDRDEEKPSNNNSKEKGIPSPDPNTKKLILRASEKESTGQMSLKISL